LEIGDAPFANLGIPEPRAYFWQPDELTYNADFPIGDSDDARTLRLARHHGGRVDWFSADAHAAPGAEEFVPSGETVTTTIYPTATSVAAPDSGAPHFARVRNRGPAVRKRLLPPHHQPLCHDTVDRPGRIARRRLVCVSDRRASGTRADPPRANRHRRVRRGI